MKRGDRHISIRTRRCGKCGGGPYSLQQGKRMLKMEIVVDTVSASPVWSALNVSCRQLLTRQWLLVLCPCLWVPSGCCCVLALPVGPAGNAGVFNAPRTSLPPRQGGSWWVDAPIPVPVVEQLWRACCTVVLSPSCPRWLPFINMHFIGSCSFSESPCTPSLCYLGSAVCTQILVSGSASRRTQTKSEGSLQIQRGIRATSACCNLPGITGSYLDPALNKF